MVHFMHVKRVSIAITECLYIVNTNLVCLAFCNKIFCPLYHLSKCLDSYAVMCSDEGVILLDISLTPSSKNTLPRPIAHPTTLEASLITPPKQPKAWLSASVVGPTDGLLKVDQQGP